MDQYIISDTIGRSFLSCGQENAGALFEDNTGDIMDKKHKQRNAQSVHIVK